MCTNGFFYTHSPGCSLCFPLRAFPIMFLRGYSQFCIATGHFLLSLTIKIDQSNFWHKKNRLSFDYVLEPPIVALRFNFQSIGSNIWPNCKQNNLLLLRFFCQRSQVCLFQLCKCANVQPSGSLRPDTNLYFPAKMSLILIRM